MPCVCAPPQITVAVTHRCVCMCVFSRQRETDQHYIGLGGLAA